MGFLLLVAAEPSGMFIDFNFPLGQVPPWRATVSSYPVHLGCQTYPAVQLASHLFTSHKISREKGGNCFFSKSMISFIDSFHRWVWLALHMIHMIYYKLFQSHVTSEPPVTAYGQVGETSNHVTIFNLPTCTCLQFNQVPPVGLGTENHVTDPPIPEESQLKFSFNPLKFREIQIDFRAKKKGK